MMGDDNLLYKLIGPIEEAKKVTIAYLHPDLEPILIRQGCKITKGEKTWNDTVTLIEYPPGSRRQEMFGRAHETRLIVTFPNGFEVLEIVNRKGECVALHVDPPNEQ
jgi:hypothetical protein